MKTLTINFAFILAIMIICVPADLYAQSRSQERPGRSGEAPGKNKGATGVPIDGGASALLAAGAAYGLKKIIDHRKLRKQTE